MLRIGILSDLVRERICELLIVPGEHRVEESAYALRADRFNPAAIGAWRNLDWRFHCRRWSTLSPQAAAGHRDTFAQNVHKTNREI